MKDLYLNNFINRLFCPSTKLIQNIFLIVISFIIWRIFYPGLMTSDSLDQYGQALTETYTDWHPPLMAIVLSLFLKLGVGVGELIFFQCLSAVLGLRSVISRLITFFSDESISNSKARLLAMFAVILFLLPFLSPYLFITVIFWKDAWLTIILLWIISYLLWFKLNLDLIKYQIFLIHILLLSVICSMLFLIRHNALVIIPVMCLLIGLICKQKMGRHGLFLAIIPLVFSLCLNSLIRTVFNIQPSAITNLVISNDLASMLDLYPELQVEYPATAARHNYAPLWSKNNDDSENINAHNQAVKNEYLDALKRHPEKLAIVRIYLFNNMLYPDNLGTQKLGYDVIEDNSYGLQINSNYRGIRLYIINLSWNLGHKWYLIWISGVHLFWFFIDIIFTLLYFVKVFVKKKKDKSLMIFLLYLIPLSYYFSYLLAATSPDYRFMYPATLIMQLLVLCQLIIFFKKTMGYIKSKYL